MAVTASIVGAAALLFWARRMRAHGVTFARRASLDTYVPGDSLVAAGDPYEGRERPIVVERATSPVEIAPAESLPRPSEAPTLALVASNQSLPAASAAPETLLKEDPDLFLEVAELLRVTLVREPHRRDLHQKLLEVLCAMGDREGFVQEASCYRSKFANEADAWPVIASMGARLSPESPLFTSRIAA